MNPRSVSGSRGWRPLAPIGIGFRLPHSLPALWRLAARSTPVGARGRAVTEPHGLLRPASTPAEHTFVCLPAMRTSPFVMCLRFLPFHGFEMSCLPLTDFLEIFTYYGHQSFPDMRM